MTPHPPAPPTIQNPTIMDLDPFHKWLGIPPSEQPPHHYRLLGIDLFESDTDVIDSGAQRQMSHVRTYALGPNKQASQTLLNQLAAARVVLLNPITKREYDQILGQQMLHQTPSGQGKSNIAGNSLGIEVSEARPQQTQAVREPSPTTNEVSCPSCNGLLTIAPDYYGKQVQCSHCHAVLLASQDGRGLQAQPNQVTRTTPQITSVKSAQAGNSTSPRIRTHRNKKRRSKPSTSLFVTSIFVLIGLSVFLYRSFRSGVSIDGLASGISNERTQQNSNSRNTTSNLRSARNTSSKSDFHHTQSRNRIEVARKQNSHRTGDFNTEPHQGTHEGKADGLNPKSSIFNANSALNDSVGDNGTNASLSGPLEMRFIAIPAGEFIMGTGFESHRVTLSKGFEMGIHEVTQAQFESVMSENPSQVKSPELPVEHVSWEQASAFCQRLSASPEAKNNGYQYRLPYEAEWEYACRAGRLSRTQFGPKETALEDVAWFRNNSNNTPHPVGTKEANDWGLHDMRGNVSEWCMDWKGADKPTASVTDPHGPASGVARINRGGSWLTGADRFQKAVQSWGAPEFKAADIGFRVVRTLEKNKKRTASPTQDPSTLPSTIATSSPPPKAGEPNPTVAREILVLREIIKNSKWNEMNKQAEKLLTMQINGAQQAEAETLHEITELATYYRVGIEKSVAALNSGNDFEVRKNRRVLVVEKGNDFITILYDRKTTTYSFDELPLSLAHKLATFAIPESPRQVAAKAVYQAISPVSDKQSRDEALTWLSEIEEIAGGENPKRIAESLRRIFPSDASRREN